jgi:hypothetical protein
LIIMKPTRIFTALTLSATAAMFAMPASAITWYSGSPGTSSYGNSYSTTQSGVTMTARAYSNTGGGSTLASACLVNFSGGFGVVSDIEDGSVNNCSVDTPQHAVDNEGQVDGILLSFSSAVRLTSLYSGWATNDSDISVLYYTGGGGAPAAPDMNSTLANMLTAGEGWSRLANYGGDSDGGTYNLNNASAASTYWYVSSYSSLFGGNSLNGGTDYFKLRSITGEKAVPEPGTLALLGLGLAGIGFARRRRRA